MLGQAIALPTAMTMFAFVGVAVTSVSALIFGEPVWDPIVQNGWPALVRAQEGGQPYYGSSELSGMFNDMGRLGIMYVLNNGRPPEEISIEMPTANRSDASY